MATVDGATNYLDANGSAGDEYRVVPAGEEPADAATAVLPDQALHIPLDPPKPGVTPDGASYSYTAGDATCADLDGDGQYELVLVWDPTNARDSALPGFTGNVFVDAYTLGGERLWRMDLDPNIVVGPHFTQVVAYDLDLDGRAEVACLDGARPSVVVWRGYYAKTCATALSLVDGRLAEVARFDSTDYPGGRYEGLGNHSLAVADVDADGRDEVLCGCLALDDDFSVLWSSAHGHGDAHHLANYDPAHEGLEYLVCHEREPYGMTLFDAATGEELFHVDGFEDTGRCMMANLGEEDGCCQLWARELPEAYLLAEGSNVQPCGDPPVSTNFRVFWDGDLCDELLDGVDPEGNCHVAIIYGDGTATELPSGLTNHGSKNNVCLVADLVGDWREEIVVRSDDGRELLVYTTTIPTNVRMTTPMHDHTYRMEVAAESTGYNQPPHLGR